MKMSENTEEANDEKKSENTPNKSDENAAKTWKTFKDDLVNEEIKPIEGPGHVSHHTNSDKYLESLENKLKKMKGKDASQVTSKELLQGLREAKESQLTRMLSSDARDCQNQEAFIVNEEQIQRQSYYTELYRHTFPIQPINRQETECLLQPEEEQ